MISLVILILAVIMIMTLLKKILFRKSPLGPFKYSHGGELLTKITEEHGPWMQVTQVVALDCEMVGVAPGMRNGLARVSIVNEHGYCVYDKFVKPVEPITDFRTRFSGIRPSDMMHATPFYQAREEVADILKDRVVVGHSLENDFEVLRLHPPHPEHLRRDLSSTKYWQELAGRPGLTRLKTLARDKLGVDIQSGEHNSIEDAQASMALYQLVKDKWDSS